LADEFPNFSICGLPFYLSGETPDWRSLAHRTEFEGIELRPNHIAQAIDTDGKVVTLANREGTSQLSYDKLVIATGAVPVMPKVEGRDLPGVFLLHTMEDSFRIHQHIEDKQPQSVVIVGTGYIGLEMADALIHRGLKVTLVGRAETVLPTVDPNLGNLVEDELRRHGVEVVNGVEIQAIRSTGTQLTVFGSQNFQAAGDFILIAAGVRPASDLARDAGIKMGEQGAICVDRRMRTNAPDVYSAGDCVETWHHLLQRYMYLPLGTTAHKQGRIAGENAVGGDHEFAGSLGTQVVKVFDLAISRTGLRDNEASSSSFVPLTVETKAWDHKAYYPGANELYLRITGDQQSGRLLGAQLLGHWQSEVAKRVDVFATAIFNEMQVEGLNDLDLSYTPPFSSPWDASQVAAQAWVQAMTHLPAKR
jgi:NADPH-dependent 2,4-dienoyl-CoA reductase/sulfur reductase-like enzyme